MQRSTVGCCFSTSRYKLSILFFSCSYIHKTGFKEIAIIHHGLFGLSLAPYVGSLVVYYVKRICFRSSTLFTPMK
jgi:hypothetical protein